MKYSIKLPKNFQSKTIKELLENDWLVPRKVRHFLRIRRNILVNQHQKMFHELVKSGDTITVIVADDDYKPPHVLLGDSTEATKINILYEDQHLIIVDKPAGIKTHPNSPTEDNTLLNFLATYLQKQQLTPYVVHRLDQETSGAILFAKNPFVLPILSRMLEKREIHRQYLARVQGNFTQAEFIINKKIGRNRSDRRKRIIDPINGVVAITHVRVLKQNHGQSLLELVLATGRTHQIRVHLASLNHPIIGDPLYNPKKSNQSLQLRATKLWFVHPFTKEKISVQVKNNI